MGLISTDFPESLHWRQRVTPRLEQAGFDVLSPLRGERDFQHSGIASSKCSSRVSILRDRNDVRRMTVGLCHLELFGSARPLLGTIAELAWAYDGQVPVIGIANWDNFLIRRHLFMVEFISQYFTNEDAAVDFIIQYHSLP